MTDIFLALSKCRSVKRIKKKFLTTTRFILKQLDYFLSISMRDS